MNKKFQMVEGRCSVLCVSYNHENFAPQAIKSISDQNLSDIEVIVLDDGSSDESVEKIRQALSEINIPWQIIEQENSGKVSLNFNRARELATGEYLAFLSLDDKLTEGALLRKVSALNNDHNIAIAVDANHHSMDDADEITERDVQTAVSPFLSLSAEELLELEFDSLGTFYIQSAVFRAEVFDAVEGFASDMIGDDINLRTKIFFSLKDDADLYVKIFPEAGFIYRKHENNLHKNTLRQIQTIAEWHKRFFPDRQFPEVFEGWLAHHIMQSTINRKYSDIWAAERISFRLWALSQRIKLRRDFRFELPYIRLKNLFKRTAQFGSR